MNGRKSKKSLGDYALNIVGESFWVRWAMNLLPDCDGWREQALGEILTPTMMDEIIVGLNFEK